MRRIGMRKCPCGHPGCGDWWLTGIGHFVLNSGFTEREAQEIVRAVNAARRAIVWHGPPVAGDDLVRVKRELEDQLEWIEEPNDLIFHTVWLDDDPLGRTVTLWGVKGDHRFHAKYNAKMIPPDHVSKL